MHWEKYEGEYLLRADMELQVNKGNRNQCTADVESWEKKNEDGSSAVTF